MINPKTILVDVVAHEHANLDSFPFRYGFSYARTTQIELINCRNHKWQQADVKFEVDAEFIMPNGLREEGHFIVMFTHHRNPKIVTVWRNDRETEFFLSKLLTSLRKSGKISPQELIGLHHLYMNGQANTFESLSKILAEREFAPEKQRELERLKNVAKSEARLEFTKLKKRLEEQNRRSENEIVRLTKLVKEEQSLRQTAEQKEAQLARKLGINEKELLAYKAEIQKMQRTRVGHDLNLHEGSKLNSVHENVLHRGSSCTMLVFSNGQRKYMKTSTFDRDYAVTNKAKRLVGCLVKTTTWDPVSEPGKWSRQGYFMNVYEG